MFERFSNYFSEMGDRLGSGWNRFWFTPTDPRPLAWLRIAVGLVAFWFVASYSFDLVWLFGQDGLISVEAIDTLHEQQAQRPWTFSYFWYASSPSALWTLHILGMLIVAAFVAGLYSRISAVLSLLVVISYIHRAPLLTGVAEPVLTMLMFYLCLGPTGACLSVDAWLARRKKTDKKDGAADEAKGPARSWTANLALRLIQVHVALIYLMMGLAKFRDPTDVWWLGEATWWLMAQPDSRWIDLTGFFAPDRPVSTYLLNAWTHAILIFELAFALLIFNRWARPLLLTISVPMWISLALIASDVSGLCLLMLIANIAYVPAAVLSGLAPGKSADRKETAERQKSEPAMA